MATTIAPKSAASDWGSNYRRVALLAAAVMAFVSILGYRWLATSPFEQVVAFSGSHPLSCVGNNSTTYARADDEPSIPALEVRPGMECRFEFFVENRSGSDVAVTEVVFPVSSSEALSGVRATFLDPSVDDGAGMPENNVRPANASFATNDILAAGDLQRYEVTLEFQETCSGGFVVLSPTYPLVTLQRWGWSGTPGDSVAPLVFSRTAESTSCGN